MSCARFAGECLVGISVNSLNTLNAQQHSKILHQILNERLEETVNNQYILVWQRMESASLVNRSIQMPDVDAFTKTFKPLLYQYRCIDVRLI